MSSSSDVFMLAYRERGYIPYEELGSIRGQRWVGHVNCPELYLSMPHRDRILDEQLLPDEKPVGMCWGCGKMVDPAAMARIREECRWVETPGVSAWWIWKEN